MAALTAAPGLGTSGRPVRDGSRLVIQTWLFSRLLLVGVALWVGISPGRSAPEMLANWDVQHYFGIAAGGYQGNNDIAFFPGWPLVLSLLAQIGLPMLWAGVGVALICSALAAAALYRLGGPIAAVVWLLAPTTVFTLVPYTEAPFCAAAFWAWERARSGRWAAAASLAALACTLRVSGLFLLGALAILALTQRRTGPSSYAQPAPAGRFAWPWRRRPTWPAPSGAAAFGRPSAQTTMPLWGRLHRRVSGDDRLRALAWLLIPAGVLLAYVAYLYNLTGDWNAWYHAQATGWPRGFTWPWDALHNTFVAATSNAYPNFPEWAWVFRVEIVSMGVGVLVTAICVARRRWAEAFWVGIQVTAFACSYWFLSVNRAVLLWFPLFILIGEALSARRPSGFGRRTMRIVVTAGCFVLAGSLLCFWAWLFFTGRWAS